MLFRLSKAESNSVFRRIFEQSAFFQKVTPQRTERADEGLFFADDEVDNESDTVITQGKKQEKFKDVFNEMSKNLPDSTSTIEEKNLAISYIDRMLAADDIPTDMTVYWQNKKSIIQQEITRIKNEQKIGSGENVNNVWKEYTEFGAKYGKEADKSLSKEDNAEYFRTYFSTCITYMRRLLAAKDLTPELRKEYLKMMGDALKSYAEF